MEIVIGLHLAVEVINCSITNVDTADQNVNDKVAIMTKVPKFDINLLVAGSRSR